MSGDCQCALRNASANPLATGNPLALRNLYTRFEFWLHFTDVSDHATLCENRFCQRRVASTLQTGISVSRKCSASRSDKEIRKGRATMSLKPVRRIAIVV